MSGLRLHDMNCGLKAYRGEVARSLVLYGELHRFIPVLAHEQGYRVAELPVNHRPREHGRSRYGLERYLRGFLDLLTVSFMGRYRHRPLHLFGGLGLLLGGLGVAILAYLTVVKITGHAIGQRPLLTLGVLLVVVGMQFFTLGLISEMITSHHEERAVARDAATCTSRKCCRSRPLRVLYFGTYERDYPRNAQVIACLRKAGVDVSERHAPVWEGSEHKFAAGAGTALRLARAELSLLRRGRSDFDALVVGYPGHLDLPAAKRAARGRPVVFNPLVSLADTLVEDRARFAPGSLRRTRVARCRSRGVPRSPISSIADTEAHAELFRELGATTRRGLPRRRRRARLRAWLAATARVQRVVRRQADPPARAGDDSRGRAPRAGSAVPRRRQRPARGAVARTDGERGLADVGGVRAPAGGASPRGLRARHLRNDAEGTACHPEQGVPGARVRRPGDHRRHAGRARTARATARARSSSHPATRTRSCSRCAGSQSSPGSRRRSRTEDWPRIANTRARPYSAHDGAR